VAFAWAHARGAGAAHAIIGRVRPAGAANADRDIPNAKDRTNDG
jgi:hypothetical protein